MPAPQEILDFVVRFEPQLDAHKSDHYHRSGLKAPDVTARAEGPGTTPSNLFRGLKGRDNSSANRVPPFQGGQMFWMRNPGLRFAPARAVTGRAFSPDDGLPLADARIPGCYRVGDPPPRLHS